MPLPDYDMNKTRGNTSISSKNCLPHNLLIKSHIRSPPRVKNIDFLMKNDIFISNKINKSTVKLLSIYTNKRNIYGTLYTVVFILMEY